MELFEDPEFLNAQKNIKELVRVLSVIESLKIIVKASPKFLLIFLIFIFPLSLFQLLLEANTRLVLALFTVDLYYKSSPEDLHSDQKFVHQKLVTDSIHDCVYLVLFSTFYHLSTSAMTLTITSLYVSKPLSYIYVLSAIPRILKRLAITVLHALPLILLSYTTYLVVLALVGTLVVTVIHMVLDTNNYVLVSLMMIDIVFLFIFDAFVLVARLHVVVLLNSANVVSVLEPNTYGSTAIKKSKLLLQEKIIVNILVLLHFVADVFVCIVHFAILYDMNIIVRGLIISLYVIALAVGNFLGLTAQNLIYYVVAGYDNQVVGKRASDDCV